MTIAANGHPQSEESRKRISQTLKGHTVSPETRRKIAEKLRGRPSWNKGKPMLPQVKEILVNLSRGRTPWNKGKQGPSPWNKGLKYSAEARKRISDALKGKVHQGSGAKNTNWKGGRRMHPGGYVLIYSPGHPRASYQGQCVFEHIVVMEKHIGRYLFPGEVVHHIDHCKTNNSIENLQLMTTGEHTKHHLASHYARGKKQGTLVTCSGCGQHKRLVNVKRNLCRHCYKSHLKKPKA